MHQNSLILMRYFRDKYLLDIPGASVLDIGSMRHKKHRTYRRLFPDPFKYTGMDVVAGQNVDIVGFDNIKEQYDVVISGQVMEHVKRPWEWLKSLTKYYLKYICIIAPTTSKEHKYPIDTYRYFPDGMQDLFEYANINIVEIFKSNTDTIGIGTK